MPRRVEGTVMMLKKRLLAFSSAAAIIAFSPQQVAAAPWVRGFVVGTYEYAFHYGGRAGFERTGEIEPGSDCPHGSTIHFSNDVQMRKAVQLQAWRSQEEIDKISQPPGLEQVRGPNLTRFHIWDRAVSYRGWKRGIETYVNPFAALDPGEPEVTGRISDGFNLDGKIGNRDFTSPNGERGIDNALYRAWGCDAPWRGNGNATLDLRANDKMQDGLYTMVIRVSGNQDPMNDNNAMVEIGFSPDKIVKDAKGNVAVDYSYRILQSAQYTKMKATVRNGVVESEQVPELHSPRISWFYDQTGDADFHQGRLRVRMNRDGTATGLVGGYRNWRDLYAENTFAQDGGQQGIREHEDHVALYYALRRNADGMYNAKTGKYDGISSVYRVTLTGAFVVDPSAPMDIPKLTAEEDRKAAFEAEKMAVIRGTDTRIPQLVPPGTSEFAIGITERNLTDLPSKDFFVKTLYRQHYPGEDADGNPPWFRRRRAAPAAPAQPPKPQQQVSSNGSAVATKNK